MRIVSIDIFEVPVTGHGGGQVLSGGRVFKDFLSYLVRVTLEGGAVGWGETMPYNSVYLPASAGAARAGLIEVAPVLIGQDVRQIGVLNAAMDAVMRGQPFVKSALEMAAWDAVGQVTGWPLWMHFGGMFTPRPQVTANIGAFAHGAERIEAKIAEYRGKGVAQFSCKAAGDVVEDLDFVRFLAERLRRHESVKMDANGGWRVDEAIRVFRAGEGHGFWFEQPCPSYEECRDVRRAVAVPMVLDECLTDLASVARAHGDGVLDAVSLKPARSNGVRHCLAIRDFVVAVGRAMHVQDACGTDVVSAMIAHFAHAVPAQNLLYVWNAHDLIETVTATGAPDGSDGCLVAGPGPGLGVTPVAAVLGAPRASFG
ncbi:MAG: mandelate racemase/muconate lactonizing enzyme family protein [Pseudomonadota bacterium]